MAQALGWASSGKVNRIRNHSLSEGPADALELHAGAQIHLL